MNGEASIKRPLYSFWYCLSALSSSSGAAPAQAIKMPMPVISRTKAAAPLSAFLPSGMHCRRRCRCESPTTTTHALEKECAVSLESAIFSQYLLSSWLQRNDSSQRTNTAGNTKPKNRDAGVRKKQMGPIFYGSIPTGSVMVVFAVVCETIKEATKTAGIIHEESHASPVRHHKICWRT